MLPYLSWTLYTVLNFLHLGNSIGWLDTVGPDWLRNAEELTPKGQIDILSSLLYTGQSEVSSLSVYVYIYFTGCISSYFCHVFLRCFVKININNLLSNDIMNV